MMHARADDFAAAIGSGHSGKVAATRRICLVTPGHIATNPRLAKEADALASAGFEVSVVAADYLGWARQADKEFEGRPWKIAAKVQFGPLAPASTRTKLGLRHIFARQIVKSGVKWDSLIDAAWHPAVPELVSAASKIPAAFYIAHYPAALPAAARAARLHGARYAFDAEDFHLGEPPDDAEHDFQRFLTRAIEGRYLSGAAYVTAASPEIRDAYINAYGVRASVVLNVFPVSEAPSAPAPRGTVSPSPSLYWFSQTIGPNRGLELALEAIACAQSKPHLFLRGLPSLGYRQRLHDFAQLLGCADRLHFLLPQAPSEMIRSAADFDVGLAGEPGHTENNRRALSNKLFTYLLSGLPVVISDTIAQSRFAANSKECLKLYSRNDPKTLAAALDSLLLDPQRLASARRAAFDLGRTRYNWEIESRVVVELVERALLPNSQSDGCISP